MVKYAYLFLLVLIVASCASQKKTDKHTLASSSLESMEIMYKKSSDNLSEFDWSMLHEFENLEINIKRYDTQAKPDSLGNYPLKEEETRKSRKKTRKEEQKQKEEQKEENEDSQLQSTDYNDFQATENTQSSTDVGSPFNLNWLWLLIVLVPAYYLIKKFVFKK